MTSHLQYGGVKILVLSEASISDTLSLHVAQLKSKTSNIKNWRQHFRFVLVLLFGNEELFEMAQACSGPQVDRCDVTAGEFQVMGDMESGTGCQR